MPSLLSRAISVHVQRPDIAVTHWGQIWFWILTATFAVAGILFLAAALLTQRKSLPIFYYLSALACYVISMGYFAMAADLGWVAVEVEFVREGWHANLGSNPTRQVFWARYVSWLVATPLLMTELLLLVSASIEVILLDVFLILIVMGTGFFGAIIPSTYKWAYYFYGAIACAGIASLLAHGHRLASRHGNSMKRMYFLCSLDISILWCGYGIAWGLSEGGNVISPDGEALFYGMLDLIGGPVYGILVALTASQCLREADDSLQC
ncbi:hypothetical protein N7539_002102 [Penicillium diatomitis]|uniref:Family A G protein-coupled receptor-like protein n=1 Tax=Penicillium diatomitis TaxID=2819901 RepID=A0A9W9XHZ8_9EURO|nr:uncharacterized protein N7539_002102 [Penicillium diatomitis]KAJ5493356.1 hypothetical protein N7539_002102 [Penicillium diatomitis]